MHSTTDTPNKGIRLAKVDQWTPGIQVNWTPARVKNALYEHQLGKFTESSKIVEAMWEDDELPGALDRSVGMIVGSEFNLQPALDGDGDPTPASEDQAELMRPFWASSFPEHEMAKLTRWFVMLGVAVARLDWDTSGPAGLWTPKLRVLHPQNLYWSEGEIDPQTGLYGVFRFSARDGTHIVTPGENGWVLLSDGRESWMRCSLRALAQTWLIKQYTWRDWARYNERHGLPIVKAMIPAFTSDPDQTQFFEDTKGINSQTTAKLLTHMDENGAGFDLELLEAKDQSYESFKLAIERCDRKIQIHFQGTNTNELIGTAGSRATGETGRTIGRETASGRERRIRGDLREQLVRPFMRHNVPGALPEDTPWALYNVLGDGDLEKASLGVKAFGEGLSAVKSAGFNVTNAIGLGQKHGLELEEKEVEEMEENDTIPAPKEGDEEELAALDSGAPNVENVGRREGFVAGQAYVDELVEHLITEAEELEVLAAEDMGEIIAKADTPADLKRLLAEKVRTDDPILLARLFEKAILLSSLAARFSAQEDL